MVGERAWHMPVDENGLDYLKSQWYMHLIEVSIRDVDTRETKHERLAQQYVLPSAARGRQDAESTVG